MYRTTYLYNANRNWLTMIFKPFVYVGKGT